MSLFTFDALLPEMVGEIMVQCDPLGRLLLGATSKKHHTQFERYLLQPGVYAPRSIWHLLFTYGTRQQVRWAWDQWERPMGYTNINCALLARNYDVVVYLVQCKLYEETLYGITHDEEAMQWCYAHRVLWGYDPCRETDTATPRHRPWLESRQITRKHLANSMDQTLYSILFKGKT